MKIISPKILKQVSDVINQLGQDIHAGKKPQILGTSIADLTSLEVYIIENYGQFPTDNAISYCMHDISGASCDEMPSDKRRKPHYFNTGLIYNVLYMDFHRGLAILKLQKMINEKDMNTKKVSKILDKLDKLDQIGQRLDDSIFYEIVDNKEKMTSKKLKDIIHYIKSTETKSDKYLKDIA